MTQPLDRTVRLPQLGALDRETGEFWREQVFEMGAGRDNLSAFEPNRVFLNLDGTNFLDCSFASGCDLDADSRSVVPADFDRDGRPDLLVGSVGGGPVRLFANRFPDQHQSVCIRLVGVKSNRLGIGSRITIEAGGRSIVRDLFPANGCLGQGPAELSVGVGNVDHIDSVTIRWPNGVQQVLKDQPVGGFLEIVEGRDDAGFLAYGSNPSRELTGPAVSSTQRIAIDDPRFVVWDEVKLSPNETVLGFESAGTARAYPTRYMRRHHLCHDQLNGRPILISYCSFSRASIAFERQLLDATGTMQELHFDTAGLLPYGYSVIRDRETKSLWNPITGQCVKGPLQGKQLTNIPLTSTTCEVWRGLHPESQWLQPSTVSQAERYTPTPLDGSDSGSRFAKKADDAVDADVIGLGVRGETMQVFISYEELEQIRGSFLAGKLDGEPILILVDKQHMTARCYFPKAQDRTISFSTEASSDRRYVATDGSVFDLQGRCVDGPLAGERLTPVPQALTVRWYAWNLTFPKSYVVRYATR